MLINNVITTLQKGRGFGEIAKVYEKKKNILLRDIPNAIKKTEKELRRAMTLVASVMLVCVIVSTYGLIKPYADDDLNVRFVAAGLIPIVMFTFSSVGVYIGYRNQINDLSDHLDRFAVLSEKLSEFAPTGAIENAQSEEELRMILRYAQIDIVSRVMAYGEVEDRVKFKQFVDLLFAIGFEKGDIGEFYTNAFLELKAS